MSKSKHFKDWSVKELKEEAITYHDMIYISECYSSSDCINYENILNELARRGYTINESSKLVISK